jgi:methionine-rich copper-binding protein CopC
LRGRHSNDRVGGVRRVPVVAACVAALGLWPMASAWAHAYLVRSTPAARATVARAPERVQLWFNERLEPAYSRVSVHDRDGQRVDAGDVQVGPDERTRLSVSVPPLPAGPYTVKYRVLSVDGHVVDAAFTFTVRGAS